jgi:hypothetical protein
MADIVLRWEGQGIGCREAGELNAELCIYLFIWFACTETSPKGAGCSGSISQHALKYIARQAAPGLDRPKKQCRSL